MLSDINFHKTKTVFIGKGLIFLVFLLLIVFSNGSILKAQNPDWTVYNISNSILPGNLVTCLAIDGSGNIWMGTYDLDIDNGGGLIKYDGVNWTVYNTSNSGLPGNIVRCLAIDGSGNMWIGTDGGGLVKYDGTNWIVYNTSNSGLPDNSVDCLAIDLSGNIWIGTRNYWGGELVKYDGTDWTVYNTSNSGLDFRKDHVSYLLVDRNNNIWICILGLYGGLVKYDGTNWTIYNTSNSGLPNNSVNCLSTEGSGNIWIGTGDGLAKYDGIKWTVYDTSNSGLPDNWVSHLTIDENGNKWIGTWNGLAVFNEGGIVSSIESENNKADLPNKFILSQNYPNPFNPSTIIKYSIPKQSYVTLKVYDILGREVTALVNQEEPAGIYTVRFSVGQDSSPDISSGIYFYQIKARSYVSTKKMILLK